MSEPYRLLHTADWHLGAVFHEQDRSQDEDEALNRLVAICRDRIVDGVLIAGDIFDTPNPSADDQKRFYNILGRLIHEAGVGSVLAIAGNHDSGGRIDAPRDLFAAHRIVVRGVLRREADPADCLVSLMRRDGSPGLVAAAIPYLREVDLPIESSTESLSNRQARAMEQRFQTIRAAALEEAKKQGLPLVVAAHCFAQSCRIGGAERPVISEAVGNLGQVDARALAEGAAYAALGHLHRSQRVAGRDHWRYSGSLLVSSFDQADQTRFCCLATIPDQGPAGVEELPLHSSRPYADLRGSPDEVRTRILALPRCEEGAPVGLLRATVILTQPHAGLSAEVSGWAQERGWRALQVHRQVDGAAIDTNTLRPGVVPRPLKPLEPHEVFLHAYAQQYAGATPTEDLRDAFQKLCVAVSDGQGNP